MKASLFIFFASVQLLFSATYYVDFVGGSDAAAGTATGTAWQHSPGDTNATGTAASTSLVAGDTVKFKGGVEYAGCPYLNFSGTLASKITYDGNSAGDWGAGNAIFVATNITQSWYSMQDNATARSNLVIQSFTFNLPASNRVGRLAIYLQNNSQDIRISSCLFSNIGFSSNIVGAVTADFNSSAVYLANTRRITVADSEFTMMFRGVGIRGDSATVHSQNTTITNCWFHNRMIWLIDHATAAVGAGITNSLITGCTLSDYREFDSGCWLGSGEKPHTDGIYYRADGAGGTSFWGNMIIENTRFTNGPAGSCAGGTASIFIVGGPSVTIRSNVFLDELQSDASISIDHQKQAAGNQTVTIYNNSFKGAIRSLLSSSYVPTSERQVTVRDNIFYMDNLSAAAVWCNIENSTNLAQLNYNLYYDTGGGDISFIAGGGGYLTFAGMQSNGFEANGANDDPLFVSATDLRLTASSPARGMGTGGGDVGAFPYSASGGASSFTRSIRTGKQTSTGKVVWQ